MATAELTRQQLLIGGAWTDAGSGNSYEQIFPYTGEPVGIAVAAEYGLSAAVFSENVPAALELAQRIESGICHVNDTTVQDEPQMPFGGVKASGWGRFGGRAALEEFTELRWITVQSLARQYPI
jgi:acyl-CoA reductase-like NAD-dependent aldehyde dehydrogenase